MAGGSQAGYKAGCVRRFSKTRVQKEVDGVWGEEEEEREEREAGT